MAYNKISALLTITSVFVITLFAKTGGTYAGDLQQLAVNPIAKLSVQTELLDACKTDEQKREVAEVMSIPFSVLHSFLESQSDYEWIMPFFRKYRKAHPGLAFGEYMAQLRQTPSKTGSCSVEPSGVSVYEWEKQFQKAVCENLLVPAEWKNMKYVKQYFVFLNENFPEYMEYLRLNLVLHYTPEVLTASEDCPKVYEAYESLRAYYRSHEEPITSVLEKKKHDAWLAEEEKKKQLKLSDIWGLFVSCFRSHSPTRACYEPVEKKEV